jgi:hypothetical protein
MLCLGTRLDSNQRDLTACVAQSLHPGTLPAYFCQSTTVCSFEIGTHCLPMSRHKKAAADPGSEFEKNQRQAARADGGFRVLNEL